MQRPCSGEILMSLRKIRDVSIANVIDAIYDRSTDLQVGLAATSRWAA